MEIKGKSDEGPRGSIRAEWRVVAWDHQSARLQLLNRIVATHGARIICLKEPSAAQAVEFSAYCGIALIALEDTPEPGSLSVRAIRVLKQKGFKIVCYADGVQSWPLQLRCQALLAGSLRILDSGKPEFAQELGSALDHLIRLDVSRQNEEHEIRSLMMSIGAVGESQAMISVFRWALRVGALSDLPVLITGETGTGKQLVARAIHRLDPKRRKGPFLTVNCGAISPGLAETELFGHRRGAYTGADRDRKGLIRSAHDGILFLDEIGELEESLQAKLLRVLQENRVLGVGEDQEVPVDVRILAATNRDLPEMIQQKKFRADLFHRLNVLSIHIPSLRERPVDLRILIEHFLKKYRTLIPRSVQWIEPEFVEALARVPLPGNVRQLENLMRRALVDKDDAAPLGLSDLPSDVLQQLSSYSDNHTVQLEESGNGYGSAKSLSEPSREETASYFVSLLDANGWNLSRSLQQCEKSLLQAALHVSQGNQAQTARVLGITSRSVYNKVRKHHLHI